jgi:plasmid stability protein
MMVDLLVRGVDDKVASRLKARAAREKRSLNDLLRETLAEKAAQRTDESRAAKWARIDALRTAMGPMPDDSTDIIREMRDRVAGDPWPKN